jgi:hypothetical protein
MSISKRVAEICNACASYKVEPMACKRCRIYIGHQQILNRLRGTHEHWVQQEMMLVKEAV